MSATPQHVPFDQTATIPMSWSDYEALDPSMRHEYVDGCLHLSAMPIGLHQVVTVNFTNLLRAACPPGFIAYAGIAWKPGADEWGPDVIVCPRDDRATRFTGKPEVIIEVLSTNKARDLVLKANRYAAQGLSRYWIVDHVEVRLTAFEARAGVFAVVAEAVGDEEITLDFGVGTVTLRPSDLLK